MKSKFPILGLVLLLCVDIIVVYAVLVAKYRMLAYGTIMTLNIEVYADQACTIKTTRVDWGTLVPGESKTLIYYVKSESNVNATLSLTTGSWNPPSAETFIRLTWDREGYVLQPGQALDANLTLQVDPLISGVYGFSFNITITTMEA